jgi:hypothetical protein
LGFLDGERVGFGSAEGVGAADVVGALGETDEGDVDEGTTGAGAPTSPPSDPHAAASAAATARATTPLNALRTMPLLP